jgi:hypothetical protein
MTPVVVDTDVVSFIFKNHEYAKPYEEHIQNHVALVSFMTLKCTGGRSSTNGACSALGGSKFV